MDMQEIKEILIKHARGFQIEHQIQEETKHGTTITTKRQTIPSDLKAISMLIKLLSPEPAATDNNRLNKLTLEETINELRTAISESEGTISAYQTRMDGLC